MQAARRGAVSGSAPGMYWVARGSASFGLGKGWRCGAPGARSPGPSWLPLGAAPSELLAGSCKGGPTARAPGGRSPGCDGLAFRF
eukprot:15473471-Alexandrium_andersonii.AAC.1